MFSIFVDGVPAPQGSKRHVGRGVLVESSKRLKPWRQHVTNEIRATHPNRLDGALVCRLCFYMPRPKAHYRAGRYAGELKPLAPVFSSKRPDVDKLTRAVLDALTMSGAIGDDAQISRLTAEKRYARHRATCGVLIELDAINDDNITD